MKTSGSLVRLGAVVLALGAIASSGYTQKSKSADYWPLKKGNSWTLQLTVGANKVKTIATVTDTHAVHGGTDSIVEWTVNGKVTQIESYHADASGLYRFKTGGNITGGLTPPFPQLKYPLAAGKKWLWKGTITAQGQKLPSHSTLSVTGPVTVKTPAGTFKAFKIHSELVIGAAGQASVTMPNDYWFAPGVGLVQQQLPLGQQSIKGLLVSYKVK